MMNLSSDYLTVIAPLPSEVPSLNVPDQLTDPLTGMIKVAVLLPLDAVRVVGLLPLVLLLKLAPDK